jgi:hypothetical protein
MNIHWGLFSELTDTCIAQFEEQHPDIKVPKTGKKLDKSLKRSILALRSETLFQAWLQREKL